MAHVCPWWAGYLLIIPLRRFTQNPEKILKPYVKEGMTVMDAGCAMGFFTLDLARLTGETGKVYAVDLQQKMLDKLKKRADKAGLSEVIETRLCSEDSLNINDLKESVDFICAINVAHELPDRSGFFTQLFDVQKPGGKMLLIEPPGHVKKGDFEETLNLAKQAGYVFDSSPSVRRAHSALLKKD